MPVVGREVGGEAETLARGEGEDLAPQVTDGRLEHEVSDKKNKS